MIDYIKIIVKDLCPSILENNPLLDFYDAVNLTTGEIKTVNRNGNKILPSRNAFHNGLEFKIFENGRITLRGSLHKYSNLGEHNYNDFTFLKLCCVLNDLKDKFGVDAENCILKCLEIGVNIIPPIPTNDVLKYCFLHKTKPFEDLKNSDEGKYKQVQHSHYIIKIYNKALHYKLRGFKINYEIMRFEIKYTKMEKLNKKGIFTIADLINFGLHNFKEELLTEFNNILYYDNTIMSQSSNITNYKNPIYWLDLVSKRSKDLFNYHRKQLKKITLELSENIQCQIIKIISQKIDYLTQHHYAN